MSKTERNFWLDGSIFVALLITILTGIMLWLVIPHNLGIVFPGYFHNVWLAAHICSGFVGLGGIVIHIARHREWLKALRGRPLSGMPEKLRLNRVVDRILWFTFIATNGFGVIAWVLHLSDDIYRVRFPDRLHAVLGVAWTILVIVHIALHWKWIASSTRRYIMVNSKIDNTYAFREGVFGNLSVGRANARRTLKFPPLSLQLRKAIKLICFYFSNQTRSNKNETIQ